MADTPRLLRYTSTVVGDGKGPDKTVFYEVGREKKNREKAMHDGAAKKTSKVF